MNITTIDNGIIEILLQHHPLTYSRSFHVTHYVI